MTAAPVFGTAMLAGALAQGALVLVAVAALHALLRPRSAKRRRAPPPSSRWWPATSR